MNWMGSSWANVDVTTISKCFAAAGFSNTVSQATQRQDENEDPFSDLDDEFQNLIDQDAPDSNVTPQMYLNADEELPVFSVSPMSNNC